MKNRSLRRFAIIGLPGSGKSTFAKKLGQALDIPVHHLDRQMFEADGRKKDREELLAIEREMVKEEGWVVEGCSLSTLATRFERADVVLYFNFSRLLCIYRIIKRALCFDETLAETGCVRGVNLRLIEYIWNFDRSKRAQIEKLRNQYPSVKFQEIKSPQAAAEYFNKL